MDSWWVLEPASGSVMANTILVSPLASWGSQVFCWVWLPYRAMTSPEMALETRSSSMGQPWAAVSSQTRVSSARPAPPPPNRSGRLIPMKPCFAEGGPQLVGGGPRLGVLAVVGAAERTG